MLLLLLYIMVDSMSTKMPVASSASREEHPKAARIGSRIRKAAATIRSLCRHVQDYQPAVDILEQACVYAIRHLPSRNLSSNTRNTRFRQKSEGIK